MKPLNLGDIQVGGAVDLPNKTNKDRFFMAMYLHSCNSENKTMLQMVIQSQTKLLGHFHEASLSCKGQLYKSSVLSILDNCSFLSDNPQPYAVHANKLELVWKHVCHQEKAWSLSSHLSNGTELHTRGRNIIILCIHLKGCAETMFLAHCKTESGIYNEQSVVYYCLVIFLLWTTYISLMIRLLTI